MLHDFLENSVIMEDMAYIESARDNWLELKNKSVYITGASGMIASYLAMFFVYLNELRDYQITIYAGIRNSEKAQKKFGDYVAKPYFHLLNADVNQAVEITSTVDYIIHAASLASPQYYGKMPVETMLPNIVGTNELLKYAVEHNIKSFLFLSSGSVYGSVDGAESITEEVNGKFDFLAPGNVYGESKRCGEALSCAYFREYGVPIKIARIHHTYGPTLDARNDSRVFAEFVNNILLGQDIIMKGPGTDKRAFCYLADTVSALLRIMVDGTAGEVYNVGNCEEYLSILELAEKLVALFPEKQLRVVRQTRQDAGYSASPEKRILPVNVDKLKSLGWSPSFRVEQGFARTIRAIQEFEIDGVT